MGEVGIGGGEKCFERGQETVHWRPCYELYLVPIQKEGFLEQAKQDHKVVQEQSQKDKQQVLFEDVKTWESKNGSLDGFDSLKVDIISVNEQTTRGVSQTESEFHET
jgi:hypothetical protein